MGIILKKCMKCSALVQVIDDCKCDGCGIRCCNEEMVVLDANSVSADVSKHMPEYEVKDDKLYVTVNHVMEDDHYIEWISVVVDNKEIVTYLTPGKSAVCHCKYVPGSIIYAYCNKHGLWSKIVS